MYLHIPFYLQGGGVGDRKEREREREIDRERERERKRDRQRKRERKKEKTGRRESKKEREGERGREIDSKHIQSKESYLVFVFIRESRHKHRPI